MKIKVLFIIWSLEKGGAERFLVSLVKSMDRTRIEPVVCCLNWKGMWATELEERGIQVIELNKRHKFDIKAFIDLFRLMRKERFLIVNTYLWTADVIGRLAAFLAGTPIVITTAQNVDQWKGWWHRLVDRLLSLRTKMLIAVSGAVKDYYHQKVGIPLSKIMVIPNAIEWERFTGPVNTIYLYDELGLTAKDFILVCIGRLTRQKGQRYLLGSISRLCRKYPQLKVLFVGYGEEENNLLELAQKLGIDDIVRFLGYRQDIAQILHLSNALVLPSLYEGLPLCVLEAMAAAKPVVATRVGGVEELVKNGQTGFIVAPENIEALAGAINNLINLRDQGKGMGEKGRQIVINNFSAQSIAQKTDELFLALAKVK